MDEEQCQKTITEYISAIVDGQVRQRHRDLFERCVVLDARLTEATTMASRMEAERDEAREDAHNVLRELCATRDELDQLRDECAFYRADAGYWRRLYETEREVRLDERQQLLEEGGLDTFWAMMARVMAK